MCLKVSLPSHWPGSSVATGGPFQRHGSPLPPWMALAHVRVSAKDGESGGWRRHGLNKFGCTSPGKTDSDEVGIHCCSEYGRGQVCVVPADGCSGRHSLLWPALPPRKHKTLDRTAFVTMMILGAKFQWPARPSTSDYSRPNPHCPRACVVGHSQASSLFLLSFLFRQIHPARGTLGIFSPPLARWRTPLTVQHLDSRRGHCRIRIYSRFVFACAIFAHCTCLVSIELWPLHRRAFSGSFSQQDSTS